MYEKKQQNARILHDSCPKNYHNTQIFIIFARKFNKIPEFYMIFFRKMLEFYIMIARKISSSYLFWGGEEGVGVGARAPVSYACGAVFAD